MPELAEEMYVVVSLGALSVLIVVSNVSVYALVCFNKRLRTYTNWFTLSLAVSDILAGAVLMPLTLFKPESVVVTYLSHLILLWGVVNICALTYDRFVAAMMPLQYPCRIPKIFKRTLVAVWLIPTIISLLPLFWATDRASIFHKWYIACLEVFGVVVPYIFISVAYIRIFKQVRHSLALRKKFVSAIKQINEPRRISQDAKVAKVFCIISAAFLFSWMPIIYMTTADIFFGRLDIVPSVLGTISFYIIAVASLVNPFVYAFLKPDFKVVIRNICRKSKREEAISMKPLQPFQVKKETASES